MKRSLIIGALVLATALLTLSGPYASAGETVYRWVDDRGDPVNSDRPPPKGVDYEVISTSSSMVRAVDAEEGVVPLEVNPSVGNEFEQVNANKPKIEKNPEFCKRAQDNLQTLDSGVRIRIRNDEGELGYITSAQREFERKKATDTISAHCE